MLIEWKAWSRVHGAGGRSSGREDWETGRWKTGERGIKVYGFNLIFPFQP